MQDPPKVTIICLCYNHEKFVASTLQSVINQTYKNIQLIVVDDFSQDNSVGVINEWIKGRPNIVFIKNKLNMGNTKSFNKALIYAMGEYIIDLAADDVLLPYCVAEQIYAFKTSKLNNLAMVYSNISITDEHLNIVAEYYKKKDCPQSGDIYKMVIGRTVELCSVGSMIKKSALITLGGYSTDLAYEDLDLWVRLSRRYNVQYIPKILVLKRELPNSLSSFFFKKGKHSKKLHQSSLKILKKIFDLNRSKVEYRFMLKRIKFEALKYLKAEEFALFFKLFPLAFRAILKSIF